VPDRGSPDDVVGGATFGQVIEHPTPRGVLVNIATANDVDTVTFHASRFDRAYGATIYTLISLMNSRPT
jgi:hypothetical protein